jgi:hypothetical protein
VNVITAVVSKLIPLTWALVAIRGIIMLNQRDVHIWRISGVLVLMDAALLVGGYLTFVALERKTRRDGTIGMH